MWVYAMLLPLAIPRQFLTPLSPSFGTGQCVNLLVPLVPPGVHEPMNIKHVSLSEAQNLSSQTSTWPSDHCHIQKLQQQGEFVHLFPESF
jgi:hypothetical protein